jgi:hypothetical protein
MLFTLGKVWLALLWVMALPAFSVSCGSPMSLKSGGVAQFVPFFSKRLVDGAENRSGVAGSCCTGGCLVAITDTWDAHEPGTGRAV